MRLFYPVGKFRTVCNKFGNIVSGRVPGLHMLNKVDKSKQTLMSALTHPTPQ